MRITCPDCHGAGTQKTGQRVQVTEDTYTDETVPCTGCNGQGWVEDGITPVLPPPPPPAKTSDGGSRLPKPRRAKGWLLAVGLLILVGLFGYVLNQQPLLKPAPDIVAEAPRPESFVTAPPATDAPQSADTLKRSAPPMQVVYMVTHKHRLRDCHGRLTFSREGLRFDSDEPQDSFAVRREDVTIEGDALRIRDKMWRFEFDDGVRVERIFQDWKAGTLRPVSAP